MQRFILIPPKSLPYSTLESLLVAYLTRQGYDTSNTDEKGILGEVSHLIKKLEHKELFLIHDLETQTNEVMSRQEAKKWIDLT